MAGEIRVPTPARHAYRRLLRTSLTVGAASVLASALAAQSPPAATRGLAVVPAPIGAAGETLELYTGSYALLVGVSRYDNPAWSSLASVPGEMEDLAGALTSLGFARVEKVVDPTGQQLRQAIADFMKRYDRDGARLLFVFSGHGWTLDGQRGYFVTRDSPDPNADRVGFRDTALPMQQVVLWAEELFACHAMFAFDSCFSGTIFRTRERAVPSRITATTAKPVRQFLSPGDAGETVPAKSIFIPLFVRGIRGAADLDGDGYVTGTELGNYVQYEVFQNPAAQQKPQFGKIRDPRFDEGDLVFAVPLSAGRVAARARPQASADAGTTAPPASSSTALGRPSGLDTDVARRSLAERSVAWSAASLASVLTSVDLDVLDLFLKGGVEAGMILEAMGTQASDGRPVAEAFFNRAKGNKAAMIWLGAALDRGLDPNATIKGTYYKKEGLLNSAVRAGNAEAVELLIDKGASPHAYQELWFTEAPAARFLFPLNSVIEHDSMSFEEKGRILKRYLERGAIVPTISLAPNRGGTYHTAAVAALSKAESRAGMKVVPTVRSTTQASTICSHGTKRDRFDWCRFYENLPTHIWADKRWYHDFHHLELLGLMNLIDGKAYLLGLERDTYGPGLAVIEVSRDARAWQVFRHMTPQVGMGHCQTDSKGFTPERCWRRISMTYLPDKKQMMVEDYYPYQVGREFPAVK